MFDYVANTTYSYIYEIDATTNALQQNILTSLSGPEFVYVTLELCIIKNTYENKIGSCTIELPNSIDFQYEMVFVYEKKWEGIIVGELIRRNGTFFRNKDVPYTLENPCWNNTSNNPNLAYDFKNGRIESSFCCTKFAYKSTSSPFQSTSTEKIVEIETTTALQSSGNFFSIKFQLFLLINIVRVIN